MPKIIKDLNKGIIITPLDPDETFSDDPLRMLRAVRFAAKLNFQVASNILDSIRKLNSSYIEVNKPITKNDLFKKIIDEMKDYVLQLSLQNWGEATLVKELPEMIKYASNNGIFTRLSTNFSIKYDNNFFNQLIKSGLGILVIDLDGTDQATYEKYRVSGNLELVLENTRKDMQELREALKDELHSNYFFTTDSPAGGISGSPGPILINDDKDEVPIDSNWKDIGAIEHTLYQRNTNPYVFLLKKTNYFKELHEALVVICRQNSLIDGTGYMSQYWMERINSALYEIRSNISSDNENKFYWRELKKNIDL